MTTLREHAEQYLAMRRALGFKLTTFGHRLLGFVTYLEVHQLHHRCGAGVGDRDSALGR
jgi:hypothetical protein